MIAFRHRAACADPPFLARKQDLDDTVAIHPTSAEGTLVSSPSFLAHAPFFRTCYSSVIVGSCMLEKVIIVNKRNCISIYSEQVVKTKDKMDVITS